MLTRVKICCIASRAEMEMAVEAGASAVGLVSAMPSGPGPIDEALIAELAAAAPPHIATFLLTALQDVDAIVAQHARCRTTTLQLVDELTRGTHADLRAALPGVALVQVVHVAHERSLDEALAAAPYVDALLLDSGNPAAATKELGGTGRAHDWAISRRIVELAEVPVWLAGGLSAANVADAVHTVRPYGLDICSGVRTGGRLDPDKLRAFMAAARAHP